MAEIVTSNRGEANAADSVVRREVRETIEDPISLIFRDGMYRGQSVYLGTAITSVDGQQSATWAAQDGHSIRQGGNFKSVSPREVRLELDFYDAFSDVSHHIENLYTMQEIDPASGRAPTMFYQEGPDIAIAPLVCDSISYKKGNPFLGAKGFRQATATVVLKVLGGKTSDHRLARPFTQTELTQARASLTQQERQRQGGAALAEQAFISCLGEEQSEALAELVLNERLGDANTLRGLPTDLLVQASVAGFTDAEALQQAEPQLRAAIAAEMAKKIDGVGSQDRALARAILGGATLGLNPDLIEQLPELKADYELLAQSILKQDLGESSAVFSSPSANQSLINIAGCGLSIRPEASELASGLTDAQQKFFEKELGAQATDPAAREQLILKRLNDLLKKDASEVQSALGLGSKELAEAIRNSRPFDSKESFVNRVASDSTVTGHSIWKKFFDSEVSKADNSFELEGAE